MAYLSVEAMHSYLKDSDTCSSVLQLQVVQYLPCFHCFI